jgi:hypothetical protein
LTCIFNQAIFNRDDIGTIFYPTDLELSFHFFEKAFDHLNKITFRKGLFNGKKIRSTYDWSTGLLFCTVVRGSTPASPESGYKGQVKSDPATTHCLEHPNELAGL